MTRGFSLYLDALRAVAAFVVFFSHFAYSRFTGGAYTWFRDYNFGSDAVIVFFVMSGLLIAYAAERSDNLSDFTRARAARLYSVALPAIFLTFVLDSIGRAADPNLYQPPWDRDGSSIIEFVRAITFTNEIWFSGSRLGTNGPYWSLAYEAWYYALFAVFFFVSGAKKWALIIAGAIFVGPRILLLAPCWIAGVVFYNKFIKTTAPTISASLGLAYTLCPVFAYAALQYTDAPTALYAVTALITGLSEPGILYGFSNEFLWNYVLTALIFIHLRGVLALPSWLPAFSEKTKVLIRWPAQRSFSLYLFHYPLISCLTALSPLARNSQFHQILILGGALAISFMLAEATELRLHAWLRKFDHFGKTVRKHGEYKSAAPPQQHTYLFSKK
ncbi:acyltransferase [Hyphococcus flavus]|uniref:Acyltransferase n=1 Tax=Hyphococcus flavus TaxID=1866326 RepID=A0AAF0CEP6_9PROT|nr:acyltransferase [Hyphococcus flavus]WDI31646.1 acyltransferase [Hyphococcus flavus]